VGVETSVYMNVSIMGCGCNKKEKKTGPSVQEYGGKKPLVMPSITKQAWNFTKSLTKYVKSGMHDAGKEVFEQRIAVCNTCPWRKDEKCSKCGCFIDVKAKWGTSTCPDDRWPEYKIK